MTKKYPVACSKSVRMMPGRPSGRDNPVPNNEILKLTKTTTEKAMASKNAAGIEGEMLEDASDQLPKNMECPMYANISEWGDLLNTHRR